MKLLETLFLWERDAYLYPNHRFLASSPNLKTFSELSLQFVMQYFIWHLNMPIAFTVWVSHSLISHLYTCNSFFLLQSFKSLLKHAMLSSHSRQGSGKEVDERTRGCLVQTHRINLDCRTRM